MAIPLADPRLGQVQLMKAEVPILAARYKHLGDIKNDHSLLWRFMWQAHKQQPSGCTPDQTNEPKLLGMGQRPVLLLLLFSRSVVSDWLSATPRLIALQAPLSMWFPRQAYWSGWPFPSPGGLPNPGIESTPPASPILQLDSITEPQGSLS